MFPASGNILSAAGSTASNIASSVFSFFKGGDDGAVPSATASAGGSQQTLDVPTLVVEEPINQEQPEELIPLAGVASDPSPVDIEQEKLLRLTKGSAARWKLVKTLRDKKAEAANSGSSPGASSPVNEAVRNCSCLEPIIYVPMVILSV